MNEISNICINKINEYVKEMDKKDMKFLNKKRERTNDITIDDNSFPLKEEFKFIGQNIENNDYKNINDEYIYVGCEDGNIQLVKLNNESIFNILF